MSRTTRSIQAFAFASVAAMAVVPGARAQGSDPAPQATEDPHADKHASAKPDQDADLAKKLSNPVAALINVPIQYNYDHGAGPDGDGYQHKINLQPVIPFKLSDNWNLISRTILPVIFQGNVTGSGTQNGLGDTLQSLFLSPAKGKLIWGAGPALLLPTATNTQLGGQKWCLGPTLVMLVQTSGWTFGFLGNQIWSFAGKESRSNVSSTYLQPFITYTTKTHTTIALNSETTFDWEDHQWTVPINLMVNQLFKIGPQIMQAGIGARYYAAAPSEGPDWGLRGVLVFLFPR